MLCLEPASRGVEEWIIAEVENRTSAGERLVAREAPVDGRVDGTVLKRSQHKTW